MAIVIKDRSYGIDLYNEEWCVYTSGLDLVGDPMKPYDAISVYGMMNENFKGGINNVMLRYEEPVDSRYHQRGVDNGHETETRASVNDKPICMKGRFGCLYNPVHDADWSVVRPVDLSPVGDVWIEYIGDGSEQKQSTDAALVDDRSGVTFTAELCIPWDAPEAIIDINSADLVSLGSFPDKVGLFGRRRDAAVSRILAGRDSRSVRFLVPDGRVVERGYHDVTVVDMEDDREPMLERQDMTRLRELWPVEVFDHMKWYQQDLELMRKSAEKEYSQTRPMPCRFCGKVIRVDMYHHVARLHLDLVQLWRCLIAWCTTWKGSPQDCLEHVRSGHDAPWITKTAIIEKYAPPWTVRRELWTDSLRVENSGISTDMLLFSELGMALMQHYRVYKGGLPDAVFRTDYMTRLRRLLRSPGQSGSPPETGSASTPTSVRRLHRSSQPKRLFPEAGDNGPVLTEQDPADMIGETVIDCRPSVLPVSIPLSGLSPDTVSEARKCVSYGPSEETGKSIMDMDTNEIIISRIVGYDWEEAGTDLEDEMPTPVSSPIIVPVIPPAGTADPYGRGDGFDLDLAKVMCDVSVIPSLITPLDDVEVPLCSMAAEYAAPSTPAHETVLESPGYTVPEESAFTWMPGFVPVSEFVLEEGGYLQSLEEPLTSPVTTPVVTTDVSSGLTEPILPVVHQTPGDKTTASDTESAPKTERAQVFVVESMEGSSSSAMCADGQDVGPDLSREGPFDACEAEHEPGQSPLVLNSMPGCQYRMTSYDDRANRDDLDPAYGIHLHDPRMMEYMGAPESAGLLGRTPEYWLEHMGRERTVQAALRLHHDASLIMTNVQIMSQFITSLNRTASEVMRTVYDREPFPTTTVDLVTPGRRIRRAAHYMAAMGLWRPTSAPVFPGPISVSSCNSCMVCEDCFPDGAQ